MSDTGNEKLVIGCNFLENLKISSSKKHDSADSNFFFNFRYFKNLYLPCVLIIIAHILTICILPTFFLNAEVAII